MIVSLLAFAAFHKQALKLPSLFSDNMVLQRDTAAPIYGTANPAERVIVQLNGKEVATKAGPDGKWLLRLPPLPAGGPYTALVQSQNDTITLKNVLVGEVWVCSGQSNMEFPESAASDYAQAQDEVDPSIRLFTVAQTSVEEPATDVRGFWVPSSKDSISGFSAVALAFGRELHNRLNVPVGLIQATWGGTRAEAWTSREALGSSEILKPIVEDYLTALNDFPAKNEAFHTELHEWIASRADTGNEGFLSGWENRIYDDSGWKTVQTPCTVDTIEPTEDGKPFDGAVWFRRTFEVPEAWAGKALKLELGTIADYDDAYVNGTKVGYTKIESQEASKVARSYRIAPGVLLQGTNSIAIRIYASQGACGFTGRADQMRIVPDVGPPDDPIQIAGQWRERVERIVDTSKTAPHMPFGPGHPNAPGGLFNGMIQPIMPFGIKGVIWYQGESNVGEAYQYQTLFTTLIRDWRQRWNEGTFPFYFVQLANYKQKVDPKVDQPGDSDWAELRESQAFALKVSKTGLANAIDLGEASTIHPTNKREVGRRLSTLALSLDYGVHTVWSGPTYHYMTSGGDTLRVFFQHTEDGLKTTDGKPPVGFAIAGDDRKFYWADAHVEGTAIVLSNPNVPNPIAVRYGWADNPDVNLCNSAGMPMVAFRTDKWPQEKKQP